MPILQKNNFLIQFICFIFTSLFASSALSSDGPQNSGRLQLKASQNHQVEAILQVDRKALQELFSTANTEKAAEFLNFFWVSSQEAICPMASPASLANENTISTTFILNCPKAPDQLKIQLTQLESLPKGFSLGVRTNFEHFVLDIDNTQKETFLSPFQIFFRSGLSIFSFLGAHSQGSPLALSQLGRPFPLYFGGLSILPVGIWWLLLVAAIGVSNLKFKQKVLAVGMAIFLSGWVAYFILFSQMSLRLLSVNQISFSYLACISYLTFLSFRTPTEQQKKGYLFLLIVLSIFSGFEFSLMLRWLEGNRTVPLGICISSFFAGLTLNTAILMTAFLILIRRFPKKGQLLQLGRFLILGFSLYSAIALAFKLM
jgi:hypothetical protein